MAYFIDLFSPETQEAFSRSDRTVAGFRLRQKGMTGRVKISTAQNQEPQSQDLLLP